MGLSVGTAFLACTNPLVRSLALHVLGMEVQPCNLNTQEVGDKRIRSSRSSSPSESEMSFGYMKLSRKGKEEELEEKEGPPPPQRAASTGRLGHLVS